MGRVKCPWPLGERVYIALTDGSTLTYDLYQPIGQAHEDDVTVAVCPGVGNSSESVYIRTFVHYAQCHGYRTAVLNHIGVIDSIQVTSPRIFTYGKLLYFFNSPSLQYFWLEDTCMNAKNNKIILETNIRFIVNILVGI